MHSKRALYKPAATGKVTTKDKRKPLAQGRLVSKPHGDKEQEAAKNQNENLPVPLPTAVREDSSARCRRDLSALMRTSEVNVSVHDPISSPRREQPYLSFHDSPRAVHPSHSLDISDTESELLNASKKSLGSIHDVLVVDASRCSVISSAHSGEVAVAMGYANSPARVVCHSPGRVHGNLRQTGDTSLASQVLVDRLPSVNIGQGNAYDDFPQQQLNEENKPHNPMFSGHHPVVVKHQRNEASPKPKVVQTLFRDDVYDFDTCEQNKSTSPLREMTANSSHSDQSSIVSVASSMDSRVSDMDLNKENMGTVAGMMTSQDNSTAKSESMSSVTKSAKKKKAPRFVASRYMSYSNTTMLAPKLTGKATDKSLKGNNTTSNIPANTTAMTGGRKHLASSSRTSSSMVVPRKVASGASSQQHRGSGALAGKFTDRKTSSRKVPGVVVHGTTPETRSTTAGTKSSTPTSEGAPAELLGPDASIDVSAIGPPSSRHIQSSICASPSFETFDLHHPPGSGKKSKFGLSSSSSVAQSSFRPPSARKKKLGQERGREPKSHVTQLELDVAYARYLQWVFLESKAKNTFKQQEKHFMHQTKSLWDENERLRQKKEEMTSKFANMRHINNLDEALDTQESGLVALTSSLPQFSQEYNTLARALDTTLHQIPTRGVLIPKNTHNFQDELLHTLSESEQLLGELSVMTRPHTAATDKCATSLDTMLESVQKQISELKRGTELLAAAKSLSTHQASLQIQHIQARES